MNSKEYWKQRGELTQNHLMQYADDFIPELEIAYQEAIDSIEKDIDVFFQRFVKNEGMTLTEAKKLLNTSELNRFKMTLEEYIQKGKENAVGTGKSLCRQRAVQPPSAAVADRRARRNDSGSRSA